MVIMSVEEFLEIGRKNINNEVVIPCFIVFMELNEIQKEAYAEAVKIVAMGFNNEYLFFNKYVANAFKGELKVQYIDVKVGKFMAFVTKINSKSMVTYNNADYSKHPRWIIKQGFFHKKEEYAEMRNMNNPMWSLKENRDKVLYVADVETIAQSHMKVYLANDTHVMLYNVGSNGYDVGEWESGLSFSFLVYFFVNINCTYIYMSI